MIRGAAVGFAALFALLTMSPATAADKPFAHTVDQIVTQLREDPVLVQRVLGTGDSAGVHDDLSDLVDDIEVPAYVVLAAIPDELVGAEHPAEQAAALFRAELGDGLYVVHFSEGTGYVGTWGRAAELELNAGRAAETRAQKIGPQDYNRTTAALEAALVLHSAGHPGPISDAELRHWTDQPWAFVPTESFEREDQLARRWVYTIAAALAVLIGGLTLTLVGTRHPLPTRAATTGAALLPNGLLAEAQAELERAQHGLDQLPVKALASTYAVAADEALQAARRVIGTGDPLDEVGAQVLALIAGRELDRIDHPTRAAYRPCIVDPRHGEGTETLRLSGSTIDAPACRECVRRQGTSLEFLQGHTWRGDRPYLQTRSVWARTGFGAVVDDLARQVLHDRGARR